MMALAQELELRYNYKTCFSLELEANLLGWNKAIYVVGL